jgi:hypothetical protein
LAKLTSEVIKKKQGGPSFNHNLLEKMNENKLSDMKKSIAQFQHMKEQIHRNKISSHPVKTISDKLPQY